MTNFIEEFYYGNIDPQARSFEQNKKVQRDMQILTDNEDFLTDKLSGEEKKRFIQYVDAWASVNGESTLIASSPASASAHSLHSIPSSHRKHPMRII